MRNLAIVLILAAALPSFAAVPQCAIDPKATDCSNEVLGRLPSLAVVPSSRKAINLVSRDFVSTKIQWEAFHAGEALFKMQDILEVQENLQEFANEFDVFDEHITEITKILNQCDVRKVLIVAAVDHLRGAYAALDIDATMDDATLNAQKALDLGRIMRSPAMRGLAALIDDLSDVKLRKLSEDITGGLLR